MALTGVWFKLQPFPTASPPTPHSSSLPLAGAGTVLPDLG